MRSVAGGRLSPENSGCTPGSDSPAGRLAGAVGANARACAASAESEAPKGAGSVGAMPPGEPAAAGCLLFHHCWDICASISSIFLSVTARSSGEVMLVWKNEGRAVWSSDRWPWRASRWRSLRSLVELAAPHEIVAALALDHFLEHLLAVLAFALLVDGVEAHSS